MPLQKETEFFGRLTFIPQPENRLIIAQKTAKPPQRPTLDWYIELFNICVGSNGWLDVDQMQGILGGGFIKGRGRITAQSYVDKIATHMEYATPQLGLLGVPVALMRVTLLKPFEFWSVSSVENFLDPYGSWSSVSKRDKRSRFLQAEYSENGNGLVTASQIFKEALIGYKTILLANGHADNLR